MKFYKLADYFIREQIANLNIDALVRFQTVPEDILRNLESQINWKIISKYQTLSEDFMSEFVDKIHMERILRYQSISERTLESWHGMFGRDAWLIISIYQKLTLCFILLHQDKLHWDAISHCQQMSESFIRLMRDKICFDGLSRNIHIIFSDNFMRDYADELNVYDISGRQIVPADLLRNFKLKYVRKDDE